MSEVEEWGGCGTVCEEEDTSLSETDNFSSEKRSKKRSKDETICGVVTTFTKPQENFHYGHITQGDTTLSFNIRGDNIKNYSEIGPRLLEDSLKTKKPIKLSGVLIPSEDELISDANADVFEDCFCVTGLEYTLGEKHYKL